MTFTRQDVGVEKDRVYSLHRHHGNHCEGLTIDHVLQQAYGLKRSQSMASFFRVTPCEATALTARHTVGGVLIELSI